MMPTLLLAAGQSSRMRGGDKLLEPVAGQPLVRLMADRALETGPCLVTLPSADHPRRVVLPKAVQVVAVAGQMSDSIRAGVAALPAEATAVMILPADMPDITARDMETLKAHARTSGALVTRATTCDGKPGHPIVFDRALFGDLQRLTGDRGAYTLCRDHLDRTAFVALAGQRARLDLDTPEDWETYRKGLSS